MTKLMTLMFAAIVSFGVMSSQALAVNIAIFDSGSASSVDHAKSFTQLPATEDPLHHGTNIARLVREGNPSATIYMLQVCEAKPMGYGPSSEGIIKALEWSMENNIQIVNMSLVIEYNEVIDRMITEAAEKYGIIFIAAGGNKNMSSQFAFDSNGYVVKKDKSVSPAFPASNPHVISVGAVDSTGKIASYSYKKCDVYDNGRISGQEGSSFACARVTSKVARLFDQKESSSKNMLLSLLK